MAQTKRDIQAILSAAGTRPRHAFGQNFMIDQNLVRLVADAGEVLADDVVIEVGPGTGTLTEELLARNARVIAVEIDRDLAAALRVRFGANEKFELIEGDALAGKHAINPAMLLRIGKVGGSVKLVANLPYNIASPLVIELLIAGVSLLAFTVQKEVAYRLRAIAGDDEYGSLSVMAQLLGDVEVLRTLPPQAFWPAPKIDSALVRIRRFDMTSRERKRPEEPGAHACGSFHRALSKFVHGVFSYRRKTLRKALLEAGYDAAAVLSATGLDGSRRPEEFSPAEFLAMLETLPAD